MGTMAVLRDFLRDHGRKLAIAAGIALLLPIGFNSVTSDGELQVAANAPREGEAMTVHVSAPGNLLGVCSGDAEIEVVRGDFIVYSSALGRVGLDGCSGSLEIPYKRFASANGPYQVVATYDGETAQTRVDVEKVVNWVYVRSFTQEEQERTRIDVALDSVRGRPLSSSVFASGTLVLDVYWEECEDEGTLEDILTATQDCQAQHDHVFHAEIPIDSRASTHVFLPWDNLDSDAGTDNDDKPPDGWYNVTATFHNDVAKGNDNVPMDPTVFQEDPPGNWFEVDYS